MNSITVTGNLGKDAEVKFLSNGDPVASFSIADSQGKDKPTLWWNCSLFGKRAESLAPYLTKGQSVTVIGNVMEREWTTKEGIVKKVMDIRVNDIALQGGRKESEPKKQIDYAKGKLSTPDEFQDTDIPFLFNMNTIHDTIGLSKQFLRAKNGKGLSILYVNKGDF